MKSIVRCASVDDLPQIAVLGEALRRESAVWFPEIDLAYLTEMMRPQLDRPDRFYCAVAEKGGRLVGWLNGLLATYEWSPFIFAVQRILYVAPEARGGITAVRLLRDYIAWAEANGAKRQLAGMGNGLPPAKVDGLYRRLGFRPIGGQYLRDTWESKQS